MLLVERRLVGHLLGVERLARGLLRVVERHPCGLLVGKKGLPRGPLLRLERLLRLGECLHAQRVR
jgi:hypothetical protein